MRGLTMLLILLGLVAGSPTASAATGKVIKVLPFFLDKDGQQSLSPSLFERDAYQAELRKEPAKRSALRLDVQWKAAGAGNLKIRAELRGMKDKTATAQTLEAALKKGGLLGNWSQLLLKGDDYKKFGEVVAWRVTLWDG